MPDPRPPSAASAVFVARDDRDLRFSREWDGECLVFDRLSSDLFVVPQVGRTVLEVLRQGGPMDARRLLDSVALSEGDEVDDGESASAIERMLREFESCGLVEPFRADCCGPDSP